MCAMNMTMCNASNTILSSNSLIHDYCQCHRGYYGETCDTHYEWYYNILLCGYLLLSVILLFTVAWTVTRVRSNIRKGFARKKEENVTIFLNITACILSIVHLSLPSRSVSGLREAYPLTLTHFTFSRLSSTLWMAASFFAAVFASDRFKTLISQKVVQSKLRIPITLSLTVFLIDCMSVLTLLIIGFNELVVLILDLGKHTIALVVTIYLVIRLYKFSAPSADVNKVIFPLTTHPFVVMLVITTIYYVSVIIGVASDILHFRAVYIVLDISYLLHSGGFATSLMFVVDPSLESLRSWRCGACGAVPQLTSSETAAQEKGPDDTSSTREISTEYSSHSYISPTKTAPSLDNAPVEKGGISSGLYSSRAANSLENYQGYGIGDANTRMDEPRKGIKTNETHHGHDLLPFDSQPSISLFDSARMKQDDTSVDIVESNLTDNIEYSNDDTINGKHLARSNEDDLRTLTLTEECDTSSSGEYESLTFGSVDSYDTSSSEQYNTSSSWQREELVLRSADSCNESLALSECSDVY